MASEASVNAALIALIVVFPLAAHALDEPYYVNLTSRAAILALAGVGLNLALGLGGMVSLGHAAFFGIGGYVAAISANAALTATPVLDWPIAIEGTTEMPLIWAAALTLSALAALAIGAISLRTEGVYFIMITLAFAQMVYYFAIAWPAYGGEDGLPIYLRNTFPGVESTDPIGFFMLSAGALGIGLFLYWRISVARFGAALLCARMNPGRLATLGIEPYPVRLTAFVISGAVTGVAGALYADLNGFVSPAMLDWHSSGLLIVFVILGGVGRLFGPVAGAMLYVALETVLGGLTEHWQLALGLILLGVVLRGRGGMIGLLAGPERHG
ncbi:MAG: branched-chain amino acid ABC transporter permease [Paracoccaceae bacterium]